LILSSGFERVVVLDHSVWYLPDVRAAFGSWTAPLDALRLRPGDDAATVTARQMRELIERLMTAGQWKDGDPEILIVVDAGYDVPRLAFLLRDLPVQVLGRMRSDRVLRRAVPPHVPGTRGRPPRHGDEFVFGDPATWSSRPGPGRPPGRKNTRPTPRHDVHIAGKPGPAKRRTKKSTTPRPRRTA
jgi:hypothetical protein